MHHQVKNYNSRQPDDCNFKKWEIFWSAKQEECQFYTLSWLKKHVRHMVRMSNVSPRTPFPTLITRELLNDMSILIISLSEVMEDCVSGPSKVRTSDDLNFLTYNFKLISHASCSLPGRKAHTRHYSVTFLYFHLLSVSLSFCPAAFLPSCCTLVLQYLLNDYAVLASR